MSANAVTNLAAQFGPALGAWWLSYLVHSTVLLLAVWLIASRLSDRFDALKQTLWRVALYGGLVTATLQACVGFRPVSGHLVSLESARAMTSNVARGDDKPIDAVVTPMITAAGITDSQPTRAGDRMASVKPALSEGPDQPAPDTPLSQVVVEAPRSEASSNASPWLTSLCIVAAACGAVGLLALLCRWLATLRALRHRVAIHDGQWRRLLDELCLAAGVDRVALTASRSLATPAAIGILRPEICLPMRDNMRFSSDEARAVLAHELAHIVRRDPLWLLLDHIVAAAVCVQPLNLLARRRLAEIAEYRCDHWAAERLGDGLTLAGCLTRVAAWLLREAHQPPAMVAAMAMPRSPLARRIHRLVDLRRGRDMTLVRRVAVAVSLALIVAIVAPAGWTMAPARDLPDPTESSSRITAASVVAPASAPADHGAEVTRSAATDVPGKRELSLPELMTLLDVEIGDLERLARVTTDELAASRSDEESLRAARQLSERLERVKQKRRDLGALIRAMK